MTPKRPRPAAPIDDATGLKVRIHQRLIDL